MSRTSNTNYISIFVVPFSILFNKSKIVIKHIKLNTFVGGLIFGAIFSLIVNVITIRITDEVTKQRALEAVENEIVSNLIQANNTITADNIAIKNNALPNTFYNYNTYANNVWSNSLTLQYLEQLDPAIQVKISGYYIIYIKNYDEDINKISNLSFTELQSCFLNSVPLDKQTDTNCRSKNIDFLSSERYIAIDISNQSNLLLRVFHPTRDRLNNLFLRLIIGNKGLPILILPPKPFK